MQELLSYTQKTLWQDGFAPCTGHTSFRNSVKSIQRKPSPILLNFRLIIAIGGCF